MTEDDMHILFLCPFSRAAWFHFPWYIRTENLATHHQSITSMITFLLASGHPTMNIPNLYTFLWCLWKARNENLFAKKGGKPTHVFAVANAILQAWKLEVAEPDIEERQQNNVNKSLSAAQLPPTPNPDLEAGNILLYDAAWKEQQGGDPHPAGLGVIIHL